MPSTKPKPGVARPTVVHDTPIGPLALSASEIGIVRVRFHADPTIPMQTPADPTAPAWRWLAQAARELDEYFAGTRTGFDVPVDLGRAVEEDRPVLAALARVGYGETTTYGALATEVGLGPLGAREVGVTMARNPVPVIVPCHRVIGKNGTLTGYAGGMAGGLQIKRHLLELERRDPQLALDLPG